MDIDNRIKEAIRYKSDSIHPPAELREIVLRNALPQARSGLFRQFRQLKWSVRIAILVLAIGVLTGFTFAATTYYKYMELRNSQGQVQHRVFVGELKDFEGMKTEHGGWRFYDPNLSERDNEASGLVNYNLLLWHSSLEDLRNVFPEFKVPYDGRLDQILIAYGYNDISDEDKADLRAEAIKRNAVVERVLVPSMDIDQVALDYTVGARKYTIKVISFNNDGVIGQFREKFGFTQQFFTFPNEDTVQKRTAIGQYDASYVQNGNFQAVVWEEEERKLQYLVINEEPGTTKQELLDFASGLSYPSEQSEVAGR